MGVGPTLLLDKSILQSLSLDEAVWLDTFYYPNITPLSFRRRGRQVLLRLGSPTCAAAELAAGAGNLFFPRLRPARVQPVGQHG